MTLSSQYKVKMKDNDPLVSVQGQSKNQSSRPSRLSTRSVQKSIFTTFLSQYKVKMNSNDPLSYFFFFILFICSLMVTVIDGDGGTSARTSHGFAQNHNEFFANSLALPWSDHNTRMWGFFEHERVCNIQKPFFLINHERRRYSFVFCPPLKVVNAFWIC